MPYTTVSRVENGRSLLEYILQEKQIVNADNIQIHNEISLKIFCMRISSDFIFQT